MESVEYAEFKCSSGKTVDLRPRSYEEWEAQEDKRLEMAAQLDEMEKDGKKSEAHLRLQRLYREVRTLRLTACVKDFAARKSGLGLGDVAEIEKELERLESFTVPEGN